MILFKSTISFILSFKCLGTQIARCFPNTASVISKWCRGE